MRFFVRIVLALSLLVPAPVVAIAQQFTAKVVTTCGTPPSNYAGQAGNYLPPTMDVTGVFCSTAGSGGGSNGSVTAAGTNGSVAQAVQGINGGVPVPTSSANDPCTSATKTYTPISIATAVSTKIVTGTAAKKTYVCHVYLFAAAADNVAVMEGTGTNCGTSPAGVIGGATAAAGINLSANAGWVEGNGGNAIAATATAADDLCLITSAATQLSGVAVTVQQ